MLWEWLLDNYLDTEMNARIRGVDVNIGTFDYVFKVYLGELIFSHSDNLSKSLQNTNPYVINCYCQCHGGHTEKYYKWWEFWFVLRKIVETCQEIECEQANPS